MRETIKVNKKCPTCKGLGRFLGYIKDPRYGELCPKCQGKGTIKVTEVYDGDIPVGSSYQKDTPEDD